MFSFDFGTGDTAYTVTVHRALYTPPDHNTDASSDDYYGGWDLEWDLLDIDGKPVESVGPDLSDRVEQAIVEQLT